MLPSCEVAQMGMVPKVPLWGVDADSEHLDLATSSLHPPMTVIIYLCVISCLIQKGCAKSWYDVLLEVHTVGCMFKVKQSALEFGLKAVGGSMDDRFFQVKR